MAFLHRAAAAVATGARAASSSAPPRRVLQPLQPSALLSGKARLHAAEQRPQAPHLIIHAGTLQLPGALPHQRLYIPWQQLDHARARRWAATGTLLPRDQLKALVDLSAQSLFDQPAAADTLVGYW